MVLVWCIFLLCAPQEAKSGVVIKRIDNSEPLNAQLTLDANLARSLTQQARALQRAGKTAEALARFEEVTVRFASSLAKARDWRHSLPYSVNFLYHAELLAELKQYGNAFASYSQVIKLYGQSDELALIDRVAEAFSGRADLYSELGKTAEARADYKELVKRLTASVGVEDIKRMMRAKRYLAKPEVDTWSGRYRMESGSKDNREPIPTTVFEITKIADLGEKDVAGRYESDLARWQMRVEEDGAKQSKPIRRFILSDDFNEYEGFGWTQLYLQNKIECMDAGNFFFCKAEPNSNIKFNKNESYTTKSGIFGILLHAGVFEMVKVDSK
jgi:tetratricopeptide (TPR) repeat protein